MQANKIFTIIIPVYNAEKTIERALASLISNKDFIYQVIVVDDHCTDNTLSKISAFKEFFPIRSIVSEGSSNPGVARKTGILNAKSEWITFLDADDCLTPSSLYYVARELEDDLLLFHAQTIYYESGTFNQDYIDFSVYSCGGNFYRLKYLIDNNLLPHDKLAKSQDEYFNKIIINYIRYYDDTVQEDLVVKYFKYPVYEVHHDIDEYTSYSFTDWCDYLCRSHLLCVKYVLEYFKDKNKENLFLLEEFFMQDFIFVFFLMQGLILDEDVSFDLRQNYIYFKEFLIALDEICNIDQEILIDYYYDNPGIVGASLKGANISSGINFESFLSFRNFVHNCLHEGKFHSTNFYRRMYNNNFRER